MKKCRVAFRSRLFRIRVIVDGLRGEKQRCQGPDCIDLSRYTRDTTGNAKLQSVPDGGMTMMLLGSSLTALALVRRSFKLGKA